MLKHSPLRFGELFRVVRATILQHDHGLGLGVLLVTLFALSLLAGLQSPVQSHVYVNGEVAEDDVIAHRSLMVEDTQASQSRRDQVAALQPIVFDLSTAEVGNLRDRLFALFQQINEETADSDSTVNTSALRAQLSQQLGVPVSQEVVQAWLEPSVQEFILHKALPWFDKGMSDGVVSDTRLVLPSKSGILIRNLETGIESLRPETRDIRDIPSLLTMFTQMLRSENTLNAPERRAIMSLFSSLVAPTLTLNREASLSLGAAVAQTVEPVYYHIQKGEVVVYKGERITREQQLKLQSLFRRTDSWVQSRTVWGAFLLSLVLSLGLLMAPSGRPGSTVRRKDFLFISLLLMVFGVLAKVTYVLGGRVMSMQEMSIVAFAFPVAGAAGLSALIFAARRYCAVGLLLALFCTLMFKGGLALFCFFFLSAMINTWLVLRAQNRQDVVSSILPLTFGLMLVVAGAGLLEGFRGGDTFLVLAGLVFASAFTSLIILFAISPILELMFGYTTRFRLMELMNLEQPLMQDLMVTIPGTYHHSLVVANMVEAGAKAVGANSLLCKVGALYHDIGKLAYPDYFIENQFSGPNRHDKLAPAMSALILGSHVKKGSELAAQNRLGDEIEDIICQHHGTSLMKFFYKKAQDLGDTPRMEEYCYPGPRPQSREAAIVMLADAVEASSRTLADPTPARLKTHIDTIMKGIFADGQLDESELTFKDLHKLAENFARILTGLFHQRIAYPEMNKAKVLPQGPVTGQATLTCAGATGTTATPGSTSLFHPCAERVTASSDTFPPPQAMTPGMLANASQGQGADNGQHPPASPGSSANGSVNTSPEPTPSSGASANPVEGSLARKEPHARG